MKKQVLILGGPEDFHAQLVFESLSSRGAVIDYLDLSKFPSALSLSHRPADGFGSIKLEDGKLIKYQDVHSVYWRNFNRPEIPFLENQEQAYIASNDSRSLVESLVSILPARWVNSHEGFLLHQRKPQALQIVANLGVRIPKTLISNDPEAIVSFVSETPRCIFKPVQGGAHTKRLTQEHLSPENLRSLSVSPVTVQEEIVGTNIRVFLAGERAFCVEVATDEIDFRDDRRPMIREFPMSAEQAAECRTIAKHLALAWTGIDFRVTPDGEWVFLEANPSPMFHGFEKETKLPLLEALTDLLLKD